MGKKLLLAFLTLSAFFFTLHALPDGSEAKLYPPSTSISRSLLQSTESDRNIADPPSEKDVGAPSSADKDEREPASEWESRKIGKHHSTDKSVAGGGVIIGGLVTAIFAAIFCYIRVTRRRPADTLT